jgi:phage terminase large subunit-like protein
MACANASGRLHEAALYAQGKVRHVGQFPELEQQYCLFSTGGYVGARSPDHADACIWGLTELMLRGIPFSRPLSLRYERAP